MSIALETVTLYLVSLNPFKGPHGSRVIRTVRRAYTQTKKTLTAVESADGDAPYGLRRIRITELPKLGGMLGLCAVALTEEAAVALLLKTAKKGHQYAADRAEVFAKGIEELGGTVP